MSYLSRRQREDRQWTHPRIHVQVNDTDLTKYIRAATRNVVPRTWRAEMHTPHRTGRGA